ncbi:CPCC family cysteine-rich protein [Vibrio neptunius]|uniref:CPCC family cysteine-rich protein n=1 Tax=Vibrio neptunius TaxID=170651 RepID=UPI001C5CB26F|nr:CPCC family cysteine-rich protein [Vibrio neptunius]QXX08934.1 hypothetical protein KW548_17640 [Vibrio neptunius]
MHSEQQLNLQKGFDMRKINRVEAIKEICGNKLSTLNFNERKSVILDWWGIDEQDIELSRLSAQLRCQILENDEPPEDCESRKYDELILVALLSEYKGVRNTYIAEYMDTMGLGAFRVEGEMEKLEVCPCCNYRTLTSRGNYNICGLCNWEDNGINDDENYSGPNHMTLGEAREIFLRDIEQLPTNKWVKA